MPSLSFPSLSLPPRADFFRLLTACVTDPSDFSNPPSQTAATPPTPQRSVPAATRTDSARPRTFSRPAWRNANWLASSAPLAHAMNRTPSAEEAAQNQERHDHCALYFARTAASKKITDDIVGTVGQALSRAYGSDVPVQFARELDAMKRTSEQCAIAMEWLTPFGDAPLDGSRTQRTVTTADLDYARQSAQRATNAAFGCSKRLFAFAEITDAHSAVTINGRLLQAAGGPLNARNIDNALRTIASDKFQQSLTSGLTFEHNLQRGLNRAGTVLQHAASDAVEWLIPTLKIEKPAVYAQQLAELMPKARTTASIDWVAQARFDEAQRCMGRSLLYAPPLVEVTPPAELAATKRRIYQLRDQSDTLYRKINDAAAVTSRLVSRNASAWRHVSQAERDIATATVQRDHAVAALPQLDALLEEAKRLPNAIGSTRGIADPEPDPQSE